LIFTFRPSKPKQLIVGLNYVINYVINYSVHRVLGFVLAVTPFFVTQVRPKF